MGAIAIGSATNQLLNDTWDTANTIATVHLNNQVIIHSMNETERADAWNRNQEIYGDVSNAVSNVYANPAIIPAYYANRFEESSNIFSSSLESGNLIGAGNAFGQTIYDSYVIASTVTGATALTAQAITATNNFVTANNFRSPLVFTFDGSRLNYGFPLDQAKFRKPISKKIDTKNSVADNTAHSHEPIEYTQINGQSDVITYESKQVPDNVKRITNMIEDYLGKDFKMIKNDHGDAIFINKDNTKKIRLDVFDSHGDLPHGHIQYFDGKRWCDYIDVHRIVLKNLLELIKNNHPKFEG